MQRCSAFRKGINMEPTILSYCKIKNNTVWLNGDEIYIDNKSVDFDAFLVNLYRHINLNYPKFFKMDNLCKLGMLAAEMAIRNNSKSDNCEKDKTAVFISNNSSSLDTDRNHIKTIEDKSQYFPSPSVFVYTLPNIIIGEISIKHKLAGENAFFVTEKFDEKLMHSYTSIALQNKHTADAVCGWINVDGNEYEAFVYYVEKSNFNPLIKGFNMPHNPETISRLYN